MSLLPIVLWAVLVQSITLMTDTNISGEILNAPPRLETRANEATIPLRGEFNKYSFVSESESFQFHINCASLSANDCENVNSTSRIVGQLIAKDVLIRIPIRINITFSDEMAVYYLPRKVLSSKAPHMVGQKVTNRGLGQVLSYPYLLAKQQDLTQILPTETIAHVDSFLPSDLNLTFYTRIDWNFSYENTTTNLSTDFARRNRLISYLGPLYYRSDGI